MRLGIHFQEIQYMIRVGYRRGQLLTPTKIHMEWPPRDFYSGMPIFLVCRKVVGFWVCKFVVNLSCHFIIRWKCLSLDITFRGFKKKWDKNWYSTNNTSTVLTIWERNSLVWCEHRAVHFHPCTSHWQCNAVTTVYGAEGLHLLPYTQIWHLILLSPSDLMVQES